MLYLEACRSWAGLNGQLNAGDDFTSIEQEQVRRGVVRDRRRQGVDTVGTEGHPVVADLPAKRGGIGRVAPCGRLDDQGQAKLVPEGDMSDADEAFPAIGGRANCLVDRERGAGVRLRGVQGVRQTDLRAVEI